MSSSMILDSKYYLVPTHINGFYDWEINTPINMYTNLENYINTRGEIHHRIASKLFIQLASAIGKLHSCGIVMSVFEMGDIYIDLMNQRVSNIYLHKPRAIIYDPVFTNKAHIKDKRTPSIYAAPECKNEHGYDGFPADIYALGIIFYKMIFGNIITYDTVSEIKSHIHNLVSCGKAPPEIVAMITIMIDPEPLVRPSIISILNVDWVNKIMTKNYILMPHPCMTFPYFYCKQEYLITHIPPFNQPKKFTFTQQTHEIEANYSNAVMSTPIVNDKSLKLYESYKTFKTECELAEKILIENVNKYLELVQYDACIQDTTSLRNTIDSDKIQIFLMSNLLSIKIKEVDQAYDNLLSMRNYERMCNLCVIFNRFHGNGYFLV